MRTRWFALAMVCALGISSLVSARQTPSPTAPSSASATPAIPPADSLTISLYKNSVKPSGFVNLKVVTTNISDRDLGVYRVAGSAESIFEISVTTADGKVADETLYGRRLHGKEPHGTWRPHENLMAGTLKPGDTMDEFIYLSDVYDFSQPGEYTIEVSQAYSSGQADDKTTARPRVHSNKVVLTVTK